MRRWKIATTWAALLILALTAIYMLLTFRHGTVGSVYRSYLNQHTIDQLRFSQAETETTYTVKEDQLEEALDYLLSLTITTAYPQSRYTDSSLDLLGEYNRISLISYGGEGHTFANSMYLILFDSKTLVVWANKTCAYTLSEPFDIDYFLVFFDIK